MDMKDMQREFEHFPFIEFRGELRCEHLRANAEQTQITQPTIHSASADYWAGFVIGRGM